jgi:hypothetical protein
MNFEKEKRMVLNNILKKYLPCLIAEIAIFLLGIFWYGGRVLYYFVFWGNEADLKVRADSLEEILNFAESLPSIILLLFSLFVFICSVFIGLLGDLKVMKSVKNEDFDIKEDCIDYVKTNEAIRAPLGAKKLKVTKLLFKNTKLTFYTRLTNEFKSNDRVLLWIENNTIYPKIIHVIKI